MVTSTRIISVLSRYSLVERFALENYDQDCLMKMTELSWNDMNVGEVKNWPGLRQEGLYLLRKGNREVESNKCNQLSVSLI